jgi:hypothetical protein
VTDYQISAESENLNDSGPIKLLYTTSSVLLSARVGGHEVLYLFSNGDEQASQGIEHAETSLLKIPNLESDYWTRSFPEAGQASIFQIASKDNSDGYRKINWRIRNGGAIFALGAQDSLVLMTSKRMAGEVWNPILVQPDSFSTPTSVLIWGPWLVRNASISAAENSKKSVLRIWGDHEEGLRKEVIIYIGGLVIGAVEWNGKKIQNLSRAPQSSFLSFIYYPNSFKSSMDNKLNNQLTQVGSRIDFQTLHWSYRDSLPEIESTFSDEKWTEATIEDSNNRYKKLYGKVSSKCIGRGISIIANRRVDAKSHKSEFNSITFMPVIMDCEFPVCL